MKNKTHSGMKKRVKVTGSGKLLHEKAGKRHLLERKSSRITRRLRPAPRGGFARGRRLARERSCSGAEPTPIRTSSHGPTRTEEPPWHASSGQ